MKQNMQGYKALQMNVKDLLSQVYIRIHHSYIDGFSMLLYNLLQEVQIVHTHQENSACESDMNPGHYEDNVHWGLSPIGIC